MPYNSKWRSRLGTVGVTVNSGKEGRHMAGWEARKHTAVHHPGGCCMLSGEWTTLQCAHHRAQDADSPPGLGDGRVEADDSQGCRYLHGTGHRTDWAGKSRARDRNKQGHQAHQATVFPRVHAHLQGDRGGDFISATTQPTPHKSTKVVAQPQQFKTGRVLKHAWRIRWQ